MAVDKTKHDTGWQAYPEPVPQDADRLRSVSLRSKFIYHRNVSDPMPALGADGHASHAGSDDVKDDLGRASDRQAVRQVIALEQSICKYAVASGEPLIVDDTLEHTLLADSPVVHDGSVRSYAGIQLTDPRGHAAGTLCAWDGQPHHWTGNQVQTLEDLTAVMPAKIFAE